MGPSPFRTVRGVLCSPARLGTSGSKPVHRALVVEDQDLMRLARAAEVKVGVRESYIVGATTLEAAIRPLRAEAVDVVIIDPGSQGTNPTLRRDRLYVVDAILARSPDATQCVATGSDPTREADACHQFGVRAYLGRIGLRPAELFKLLQQVVRNCCAFVPFLKSRSQGEHYDSRSHALTRLRREMRADSGIGVRLISSWGM